MLDITLLSCARHLRDSILLRNTLPETISLLYQPIERQTERLTYLSVRRVYLTRVRTELKRAALERSEQRLRKISYRKFHLMSVTLWETNI